MSIAVSPNAPIHVPDMPAIAGVKLATAAAGIRYKGRTDVMLAVLDKGTAVAGVFTQSKCPSAPVDWCRAKLPAQGKARARWWSIPATPTPSPAAGRQAPTLTGRSPRKALGCAPARGVRGLHRRDRRGAGRHQDSTACCRTLAARPPPAMGRAPRKRDHDHRHLPEGRHRGPKIDGPRCGSAASPRAPA